MTMNIRKIAVVAGFAAGAAMAFAPLAAADDLTSTIDSEIAVMNSIFDVDTSLAQVPAADINEGGTGEFDTIKPEFVDTVQGNGTTPFDFLVYGLNPTAAGLASDPGSYNVYNGALTEYDDAYNAVLYGLLNNNALIPEADLFGSQSVIDSALNTGSDFGAAGVFMTAGFSDLLAFWGI